MKDRWIGIKSAEILLNQNLASYRGRKQNIGQVSINWDDQNFGKI